MKKTVSVLAALLLVVVITTMVSAATGTDTVVFNTSWTFQNLGDSDAEVAVSLYDTTGVEVATDSFTVQKAKSFWAPAYSCSPSIIPTTGAMAMGSTGARRSSLTIICPSRRCPAMSRTTRNFTV